jgi:ParB family chromosome partitioning protein
MHSIRKKLAGKVSKLGMHQAPTQEHPANLEDYQHGMFCHVEVANISPNPHQPRTYFDPKALKDLAASIQEKGVLQPVIIRKEKDGSISLVAGERRLRAAKIAGLEKIPAILTKDNPAEIAIIENLQRQDLSPLEEAEAMGRMVKEHNYTLEQLGKVVGKAKSTISEMISLTRLPAVIKDEVRQAEQYSRKLLVEIAKQKSPAAMVSLFNQIKESSLKSMEVRKLSRTGGERIGRPPVAIILERAAALGKNLRKLDFAFLTIEERERLQKELAHLKQFLEQLGV